MRTVATLAAFCAVVFACVPAHAQAAYGYRWCSLQADRSGAMSCYFETRAQCEATISGIGGSCIPSPYYNGGGPYRR